MFLHAGTVAKPSSSHSHTGVKIVYPYETEIPVQSIYEDMILMGGARFFIPMRMFSYLPCQIYLVKMFMRCTWPHVDVCSFMGHTLFCARHHRVTQLSTHQRVTQYACCVYAAGILRNSLSIKILGITKYQQTSVQTKDTVTIIDDLFSVGYEYHRMVRET